MSRYSWSRNAGRGFAAAAALLTLIVAVYSADTDSEEAAKTRTKRLAVKMSPDWSNRNLSDVLAEITSAIDDAGLGKIKFKFDTGISANQKVSFSGKDKTVEQSLDGLLKSADLAYSVISKAKDPNDGGLLIKRASASTAAKPKTPPKDEPKAKPKDEPKAKPKDPPKTDPDDQKEKLAAGKLDLIKQLIDAGKKDKAKERLEELIKAYPDTKAAGEAKTLLEKLKTPN